jgi:hypothetical protein
VIDILARLLARAIRSACALVIDLAPDSADDRGRSCEHELARWEDLLSD